MSVTYKKGIGRLATDRYDFQKHIDGTDFRQNANTIDLSPPVTIGPTTKNTVQEAVESLAAIAYPPTIASATGSILGVIKLNGDLGSGSYGTASVPIVSGLLGKPLNSSLLGSINTGSILFWDGSTWNKTNITLSSNDILTWSGSAWTNSNLSSLTISGDVTGNLSSSKVEKIQGYDVDPIAPTSGNVLKYDGDKWVPETISLSAESNFTKVSGANAMSLSTANK